MGAKPPRVWGAGAKPLLLISGNCVIDKSRQNGVVLEKNYQFLLWLIPTIDKFPRSQKFTLGDRIQSAALDVQESLIAATYSEKSAHHLYAANLHLEKLRMLMRLSLDLEFLDLRRYEFAARALDEVGRMVGGWIKANHAEKNVIPA